MHTSNPHAQMLSIISAYNITQTQIELGTGVSQSQISRLLSSDKSSNSKSYKKICNYVFSIKSTTRRELVINNDDLITALSEVWDGSEQQGRLIAEVIYSLGGLCLTKNMK